MDNAPGMFKTESDIGVDASCFDNKIHKMESARGGNIGDVIFLFVHAFFSFPFAVSSAQGDTMAKKCKSHDTAVDAGIKLPLLKEIDHTRRNGVLCGQSQVGR